MPTKGYRNLLEQHRIAEPEYLTICDFFAIHPAEKTLPDRCRNNTVVMNTYVSHGRRSGGEYARNFPTVINPCRAAWVSTAPVKPIWASMAFIPPSRKGWSPGINDKTYRRAVVVHGASIYWQWKMAAASLSRRTQRRE